MSRILTLGTLVTRCAKRADAEGDPHVDEWKALISEKYGELYATVAEAGLSYFESTTNITATGAASYAMPASLLTLLSVDFVVSASTGELRPLRLLMPQERSTWSGSGGEARRYAFTGASGASIELWPRPSSGTYRLTYVAQSPDLANSSDSTQVDVVNTDGEAFLVWGVAAMASDKAETDLRFRAAQSEAARLRLQKWALNRALHEPRRRVIESDGCGDPLFSRGRSFFDD
jgi:hypothetical protein